ncbi:MAG: phosphoesterase PA-phosphatase related protein [Candidatus Parcubacteria bacterium]|nr:phosphoesterase PA-phosphatase related protein [Candidatus Parcubacteria bacterium]
MAYLDFFSALSHTLASVAVSGGYVTLFLATLLEGIPLLGIFIPGHVAIIAAGFLSSVGVLNVYTVAIVTVIGAICGDYLSFALGRKYGWPFIDRLRKYFFVKDTHLEKAKRLLEVHTGKALMIGRFNPVTRGIFPFLVGASHVPSRNFWIYNSLGGIAWVVTSVALGYVLGLGFHVAADAFGKIILVAVLAGMLIVWGYRFVNMRFHVFRRYELFTLGFNLVSLGILARMIQDTLAVRSFMAPFDVQVSLWAKTLAAGPHGVLVVAAATVVSSLGGIVAVTAYGVVGSIILAHQKKWRKSAIVLLSLGSCAIAVGWMKEIFVRVRPHDIILLTFPPRLQFMFDQAWLAADPSFPSGHSVFAAAFFFLLAYCLAPYMRSWVRRELLFVFCAVSTIAVGLSRIILNVHWASDVLAGWALGIFCATSSILVVRYAAALVTERVDIRAATAVAAAATASALKPAAEAPVSPQKTA